uniref:Uncharacterized protein ravX3 n=1 Tax=Streptomyces ravidus TaxID=691266 RepID=D1H0L0_9ACTN|nr:hypothetical protein [Streptomyces ravidus]
MHMFFIPGRPVKPPPGPSSRRRPFNRRCRARRRRSCGPRRRPRPRPRRSSRPPARSSRNGRGTPR